MKRSTCRTMRDGRLRRFVGGLGLGYLHTAIVIVVGLWLTPYLLRQLGSHDYGLWLLGTQVVFYLGLTDLGVVALVPREVASASGLSASDRQVALQRLIGQTARLVLWQLPPVALAGALVIWLLPQEWGLLRGPLTIVVAVFVAAFPFRILNAVLQGLQDLAFVGVIQLISWSAGTATTIIGIFAGLGLYALTLGWVATQVVSVVMAWTRLRRSFPEVLPRQLPALTFAVVRQGIGRGAWISVQQIAQVLLSGTDIMVIGKLLGPAAIVPYACTGKLITMLANQPQMFMQLALPALSELRTSAPRPRLFEVSRSMTQVMLLGSGAIVAVVLAVNGPFVTWWVGDVQFGGTWLTALLLGGMLLRHVNVTAVYALFCFGNERRLALTSIADGVVGVTAMLVLVPMIGLYGAALGPLLATCVVSLPNNLRALAREEGTSPTALILPLAPWFVRLVGLLSVLAVLLSAWSVRGLPGIILASAVVAAAYLAIMIPVLRTPPLGQMLSDGVRPWLTAALGWTRRLTSQPTHSVQ